MGVVGVPGGNLGLEMYGNTAAEAETLAGNAAIVDSPDLQGARPILAVRYFPNSTLACDMQRDLRGAFPDYFSSWIFYCWDLGYLRSQHGPALAADTTVTITVRAATSMGTQFNGTPWYSGSPTTRDLLACIPAAVDPPTAYHWYTLSGDLTPDNPGWDVHFNAVGGGTMRYPARPFPSTFGAGGWTLLGSYHSDGNIQHDPASVAGTWTVPVNLQTHARDDHLVIVCAGLGQFTQDEALLTEAQEYNGNPVEPVAAWSTNEMWITSSVATLTYVTEPPILDDLGLALTARTHFFRGNPGEGLIGSQAL